MNQKDYAKNIETIWDWIEEQQALQTLSPGYVMDALDADAEGTFVAARGFYE